MKSNIVCISVCVAVVLLLSLCACTASKKDDGTGEPSSSQQETSPTSSSYAGGLTEKTYDPNNEESGDFGSLFGDGSASASTQQGGVSGQEKTTQNNATEAQPTGSASGGLDVKDEDPSGEQFGTMF